MLFIFSALGPFHCPDGQTSYTLALSDSGIFSLARRDSRHSHSNQRMIIHQKNTACQCDRQIKNRQAVAETNK